MPSQLFFSRRSRAPTTATQQSATNSTDHHRSEFQRHAGQVRSDARRAHPGRPLGKRRRSSRTSKESKEFVTDDGDRDGRRPDRDWSRPPRTWWRPPRRSERRTFASHTTALPTSANLGEHRLGETATTAATLSPYTPISDFNGPGNVTMPVSATASFHTSGAGNVVSRVATTAGVEVCEHTRTCCSSTNSDPNRHTLNIHEHHGLPATES